MDAYIRRMGSSLGFIIPSGVASELGFAADQRVNLSVEGDALVTRRAKPRYKLADLLADFHSEFTDREFDRAPAVGAELI